MKGFQVSGANIVATTDYRMTSLSDEEEDEGSTKSHRVIVLTDKACSPLHQPDRSLTLVG